MIAFLIIILIVVIVFILFLIIHHFSDKKHPTSAEDKFQNRNDAIGKQGEEIVKQYINNFKDKDEVLINNFSYKDKYDNSHEIDHIFFSKRGIFVIETKNRAGIIKQTSEDQFVQILKDGEIKHPFRSPMKQNEGHIKSLTYLLKENGIYLTYEESSTIFHSIIVFINSDISSISDSSCINLKDLKEKIESYPILINQQLIQDISNTILQLQTKLMINDDAK